MIIQQASNNKNRNSTAEDVSNLINSVNSSVILLQLTHWKMNKISLFNPYLNKSYEEGEIITVEKNVYYQSVMLFIKHIWDIIIIKGSQLIRTNLNICLCDAALAWYTSELFNLERVDLWNNKNSVEKWCQALKNWFKKLTAVDLISLTSTKYIMTDVWSHWESAVYVQMILHYVKSANIESVKNQLTFIY